MWRPHLLPVPCGRPAAGPSLGRPDRLLGLAPSSHPPAPPSGARPLPACPAGSGFPCPVLLPPQAAAAAAGRRRSGARAPPSAGSPPPARAPGRCLPSRPGTVGGARPGPPPEGGRRLPPAEGSGAERSAASLSQDGDRPASDEPTAPALVACR